MGDQINSYKDLRAWQLAYQVGLRVYQVTRTFPSHEKFSLTLQLRRASVSIASNIAEGYGRGSTQDYLRFLRVARGSLYEVETQLSFARDLGYLNDQDYEESARMIADCSRVIGGLLKSVEKVS